MGNRKVHEVGSANAKCRRLWAADEPGRLEAGVWRETGGTAATAPRPTGPGSTTPAERQLKLFLSMVTLWRVGF